MLSRKEIKEYKRLVNLFTNTIETDTTELIRVNKVLVDRIEHCSRMKKIYTKLLNEAGVKTGR